MQKKGIKIAYNLWNLCASSKPYNKFLDKQLASFQLEAVMGMKISAVHVTQTMSSHCW